MWLLVTKKVAHYSSAVSRTESFWVSDREAGSVSYYVMGGSQNRNVFMKAARCEFGIQKLKFRGFTIKVASHQPDSRGFKPLAGVE